MKKIFIVNFFFILLIILFLEIIMNIFQFSGLMGIQKGVIYKTGDTHYLKPNNEGIVFDEVIFTDSNGYRVPSKSYKYSGDSNIFILGDSVAFGNGVKEDKTFIGLLRKEFIKKNFLNSSAPGYQINDHVNVINQTAKFRNVDKIMYFFTLNDIYGSSNIINLDNKKKESDYNLKKYKLLNDLNSYLRNKSYLYMFIKGIGTDPSKRWFLNLYENFKKKDLDGTKNYFISLKNFSTKIQSDFIVILLPYEFQTRNCSKNILKPQKEISDILLNLNIEFKDLTNVFCNQKNPKKNFYKFDPMHLSKLGHKLVYNTLKDEINF